MKRIVLISCVLSLCAVVTAQRYDYDDIYFNPKKDIKPEVVVETIVKEKPATIEEIVVEEGQYSDDGMSYTARINMFHRNDGDTVQNRLAHIADPNYTTNVFVLTDGQYVVDVDGNNIEITENYNYPYTDWSSYYWNNPYYYGPYYSSSYYWNRSMYGWYGNYGWSVGYYDPYFYGFYNPWYDPFYSPYWGYSGCYDPYWGHHHHHHHHNCYYGYNHHYHPHYGGGSSHHAKPDWSDYNRGNENERRNLNSSSRVATNVASANRVSTQATTPAAVRRANDNRTSTSTVRGNSTSTVRGSSTSQVTSTSNNQRRKTTALPARPTTTREMSTPSVRSTSRSSAVRSSTTTTRRSTSTVRSSSSSTRSSSSYRPSSSSSSTRSSGGYSSGGGRSGGSSSSSSTRRR